MSTKTTLTETQLKCSSLPPGLAPPGDSNKLNRSRSNAGSKSEDHFATLEEDVEKEEKVDKSFFDRIFPRRSAKKRKSKEEKTVVQSTQSTTYYKRVESKPIAAPRSGAAARQRIQPIDLPPSPELTKKEPECGKASPEKSGTSPLHAELESRFKLRQNLNASLTPPQSPIDSSVISKVEFKKESRSEEIKKIKMPGLSSLQQKVLSINDEVDDSGFKSLTDLPDDTFKPVKPVTKSHSFKATKPEKTENKFVVTEATNERKISASLDSVKQLGETQKQEEYSSEVTQEFTLVKNESKVKEESDFSNFNSDVTISGPSHTAVVNISSNTGSYNVANTKTETITSGDKTKEVTTKECVSVTKIQLKRESTQITQSTVTVPKTSVPEFLNRQLNKVEAKPSNVVFSMTSPRIIDEQSRPKLNLPEQTRKFSQEDIEIIEKTEEVSKTSQPRFKKNESNKRKTSTSSTTTPESPVSEKPFLRSRSISLDSLKCEESSDKSSQDSLDKLEEKDPTKREKSAVETVVLRKKSLIKQKNDEEPELMKVFARRSLKLKDSESEAVSQQVTLMLDEKTRDSDKENQAESPLEERKKLKEDSENREPLTETAITERKFIELTEVTLRKPNNNFYARAFSMNPKSGETDEMKVKKQASFSERRITDNWISNIKNGDDLIERKISQDEIITGISPKSDFITEELLTERKNFNQRKAEWEKRAQEAQKKSVP